MSEETEQPHRNVPQGVRYSLKEIMEEVATDRRDSVFGRELVDATEIDKMFGKQMRKKKKKSV
ncbi:hypothetical protein SH580_02810 [Coraliomargarita algicola]|uniref:Uncharacterized protein n=1 Tax=Coraliomargarita algicola TaxID=3092156 RepID=A0ABZ0RKP2_9BACT|nr:hypothetical protein [Coraliomargarita sp. J2-16]WPJ96632.1 hypothetical protein SH580_02810 [Coraliomargarita sp. J2-16]